jgi:ornithine cyclodeaminase/alanine dehydrogenase-like protein (mu-crystallin family)
LITVDATRTRELLPFEELIAALRNMFVAGCEVPQRHTHIIAGEQGTAGTMLIMPAWQANGYLGVKTVCIFPGNAETGLPGLHSTYVLHDARTGVPLAQIDGNELTSRRTAAQAALAASHLASPQAEALTIIGAGRVASYLAQAYRVVRPIGHVRIWNRNPSRAHALAEHLTTLGIRAEAALDIETAVRAADIVTCATLSTQPLVRGAWLHPGSHLDLIGSFAPDMRESDSECFRRARVFVDSDEAALKSGDLLAPMREGVIGQGDIKARLADLCRGTHDGRTHAQEITVFKAVGTALADLAAAVLVYERARAGAGIRDSIHRPGAPASNQ